ncbi:MAG: SLC13 family permease [Planctomycetota bacterium]
MANWEAWLTLAVVASLLIGLTARVAATDLLALACLAVLVLAQNVTGTNKLPTPQEAVLGFSNEGLITIALLFAVVAGMEFTGGTQLATGWLLGRSTNLRDAQVRMLVPVAVLSGFLNNTPVVAALLPVVGDVCKRIRTSTSHLLLPLSYAAILGGMCTVMGTSTNLIVRNMHAELIAGDPNARPLGFFDPAYVGVPATLLGLVYILLMSKRLIPQRRPAISVSDDPQQYTVEVLVDPIGPLVGRTIEEAGLRSLPGLYVAEILRQETVLAAKPQAVLEANDALILVGALETVVDLRKIRGLSSPDDQARKLAVPAWRRTLVEAVVSSRCSLLGKTIRESRFRSHYNAAVVAVARGGKRLAGKIGDVRLEVGDVLLLEASPSFLHRQRGQRDFFLVSAVDKAEVRRHERAPIAIGLLLAMVLAASLTKISIMTAALVTAVAMIGFRCCTTNEARRSIDWSVLIVIGAAIGIGSAMKQSGAANAIASGLLQLAGADPLWSLAAVFLATVLCTELVTNHAAAVLMFSIASETADKLAVDSYPFVIAIMIAASASFLTPFGYQTNTMVYSVGGYRPRDYFVFGLPLTVLVFVVAMFTIPSRWPF